MAPRGLLVLYNPHIRQFAAAAAHTAVLAGAEVYAALGAPERLAYISDVAHEKHCAAGEPEYTDALIRSIGAFMQRDRVASGPIMRPSPKATGDAARWVGWRAPELRNDVPD